MINNRYDNFSNKIDFEENDFRFNFTFDQTLNQEVEVNNDLEEEVSTVVVSDDDDDEEIEQTVIVYDSDDTDDTENAPPKQ